MSIKIHVAGKILVLSKDAFLEALKVARSSLSAPFSDHVLEILGAISKALLTAPNSRAAPQLLSLGYWLRPAAVKRLERDYLLTGPNRFTVPRGLALHLPPANVDTLFAYSWALSFLAGNINVTRLPSAPTPVTQWLIGLISSVLDQYGETDRQIFCSYEKESDFGRILSSQVDLRVIWGGDEKVKQISRDPVAPGGLSLGFPDRKSIALISVDAYSQLDAKKKCTLAEKFYNDLFWFDQLGCGSPRVLCWLGKPERYAAEFFEHLESVIQQKDNPVEVETAISKFVFSNEMVASGIVQKATRYSNELTILDATISNELLHHVHGGGLLFQCQCESLEAIDALIDPSLQTLTYFGLSEDEIKFLPGFLGGRGGYRIVPVGEALSFGPIWDGVDLLSVFTRQIVTQ